MRMFPNNSKSVHSVKEKYDSSETTEIYTVQILYISVNNLNWTELKYPNHRSNRAQQGSRCAQGKPGFQGILPLKKDPGSEVRSEAISDEVTSVRAPSEIQLFTYVFAACTYIVCCLVKLTLKPLNHNSQELVRLSLLDHSHASLMKDGYNENFHSKISRENVPRCEKLIGQVSLFFFVFLTTVCKYL